MKAQVLLVEDSPSQREAIAEGLRAIGYDVTSVGSGIDALKAAKAAVPDIVILDVVLGDMDGYSVCRWLRLTDTTRDVAVIMLTVKAEVASRVEGLNVGADDYLPKPFNMAELEARIFAALRQKGTQKELRRRNVELEGLLHKVEHMAMTDELTGLFNRRRFSDVLRREWATSRRYRNPLTCAMLDLDHFKHVNDLFGHAFGDTVLKEVARVISESIREVDLASRYGGEEFVVLLPHTALEPARVVAERLRERVAAMDLRCEGAHVPVTISVGLAANDDATITSADDLTARADAALYQAKERGRNRVVLAEGGAAK